MQGRARHKRSAHHEAITVSDTRDQHFFRSSCERNNDLNGHSRNEDERALYISTLAKEEEVTSSGISFFHGVYLHEECVHGEPVPRRRSIP